MFAKTLPPALSFLVLLGCGALVGFLFWMVRVVSVKLSGWRSVVERFPMCSVSLTGDNYQNQHGVIGNIGSRGAQGFFDIQFAQEGLCVYLAFARRNPCLIPWSAIRRVSVSDTCVFLAVSYERPFEFFLPVEALPILRTKLPPESFHQTVSPFEVTKAVIRGGGLPRWMSALTGTAIQSAEKPIQEKRK